jgi:hypothetical protein
MLRNGGIMRTLLIDDIRNLEADVIARNYNEGIKQLKHNGSWDLLLLDHDLASFDENGKEYTGYDIMCWLEANIRYLPKEIRCVSDNPVGRDRINKVVQALMRRKESGESGW